MKQKTLLSVTFYLNLAVLLALLGYKIYLLFDAPDTNALHTGQIEQIETATQGHEKIRFAVIGEANNSIGIFERQIVEDLNASDIDFVVSAGNAVSGGGEDNYRSLLGSLSLLKKPFLLTFGDHEFTEFGSSRFYKKFGPHFYSVSLGDVRLVFLDGTGRSSAAWQERWLADLLGGEQNRQIIVFVGQPLVPPLGDLLFEPDQGIWSAPEDQTRMQALLQVLDVDAVISAGASVFSDQMVDGVRHITTGGGGGLILNNDQSFYHYLDVTAGGHEMSVDVVRIETAPTLAMRWFESLWSFIYSLFYVRFLSFLLIFSALALTGIYLFNHLFRERDYYPSYDAPPLTHLGRPLRVAMVTNNYLPFVGGVPISVELLKRGLEAHGHQVMVVCPSYGSDAPDPTVERVPVLLPTRGWIRIANPFLRRTRRAIKTFNPDIIHVHHPFWLGSLGRIMARRLNIPVIYTYHTRLEYYAHQIPVPGRLFRNVIAHWLIRRFANKCDAVIVPTPVARDYMRLIGVDRPVHVQPTGLDLEKFEPPNGPRLSELRQEVNPDGRLVFVTVSRLSPEKNIHFIIAAMERLKSRDTAPFRLLVLGDGDERAPLEKMVKARDLEGDVTFLGNIDGSIVPQYLAISDVFVFASRSETQGMVVLEAMAAGLPVVAVDSSGVDAFVSNGTTGYRTPEDIVQWTAALSRLIDDPHLRKALGENAKAVAHGYSTDKFAASVALHYEGLVQSSLSRSKHRIDKSLNNDDEGGA
ncbi:glycosyltransferase [Thalassovita taeanensis]|uniref:Glycosyltransferase involved in cell wall bisynthesis n=1 Tax=Thalassovita taeanensis TaxID=657014 RepID=A0A1H9BXM7_9RHOB|nr:glycosyltransferase [Thalassovita taeanensis]SEP93700.1 Glycosyltransferase involved in cell wall bisynthesis [Thalassovita taeanensis]